MKNSKCSPLCKGDKVGILVASSPIGAVYMEKGHRELARLGLECIDEENALYGCHYMSRDPQDRVRALIDFCDDRRIGAVWLARGGYGANLMLPRLDHNEPPKRRIPVLGSSDGCYLLWYLMERWGCPVFLAPMIYATMTSEEGYDAASLNWALFGEGEPPRVRGKGAFSGRCFGTLHGGCLSMLTSLLSTPYMPRLSGSLLIVEDVGERPYRLERMVWQLVYSGCLEGVQAILFGQFPSCFKDEGEKKHFFGRMTELLEPLNIPYAFDFPLGHAQQMVTVPLGVHAELAVENGRAELIVQA